MNIYNLIILDESGSMCSIEHQAITSMNETIQTVKAVQKKHPEQKQFITLISFSGSGMEGVKVIRDRVPAEDVTEISSGDYNPIGCTPLHDAMGFGITTLDKVAEKDDVVLVTIITDGMENSSRDGDVFPSFRTEGIVSACSSAADLWKPQPKNPYLCGNGFDMQGQYGTLRPDGGVPPSLLTMLAAMAGISVANIYYCQPLLGMICEDTGLSEFMVNLMPVFTQAGYALGLLLIIPLGDMLSRRKTVLASFSLAVAALLAVHFSRSMAMLLAASFVTGFASVSPQVFIPFVSLYSRPSDKEKCTGMVLSGLLVGILASRVISGYVGHMLGWRAMFAMAAGIMAVSSAVIFKVFPEVESTHKGGFGELMGSIFTLARTHPGSIVYSARSAMAFGSFLGLWACLAFRMAQAPYFMGSDAVGLLALCGIAGAVTASRIGKYIPRLGTERVNALGLALQTLAWVIFALMGNHMAGMIAGIVIIDIGMQCIQLSNQSATMRLCPEATSRMNTIYMVTYFIGGSLGTFLAGSAWSMWGWTGTIMSGFGLVAAAAVISALG